MIGLKQLHHRAYVFAIRICTQNALGRAVDPRCKLHGGNEPLIKCNILGTDEIGALKPRKSVFGSAEKIPAYSVKIVSVIHF